MAEIAFGDGADAIGTVFEISAKQVATIKHAMKSQLIRN
jgi:hypothetical protein